MKPSHLMSKMLHLLPEDHEPGFLFIDIFYVVYLLKFIPIYSRRISRVPEPWLMNSGRTVTWPPSTRCLMHQSARRLKMFLLSPPTLLPVLFPVLSLEINLIKAFILIKIKSFRVVLIPQVSWRRGSVLLEPLFLSSGKLAGRQEEQAHSLPVRKSSLIYLLDSLSRRNFLINTGASIVFCFSIVNLYLFWGSLLPCWFPFVKSRGGFPTLFW